MIACKEAVERLWDYIDRHLDQARETEVEQHLGLCRHCCGELEFARQVRAKLADAGTTPLPEHTRARFEDAIRRLGS